MDARLDRVAEHIARRTGLALSSLQRADLDHHVARRLSTLDTGDSLEWLEDPLEFRMVVDCLTVPETYFYRYEDQFDAFRDSLLPAMLATARPAGRPVRIWSAGCCTGEEPYTLALIAAELGCADEVSILGTDINEGYLEAAMAGSFSTRSISKLSAPVLQKYFTAARDRFVLRDELRRRVTFKWINLADAAYPSFRNGTSALDMVWCRNVLIYFDKSHVDAIIARLTECLVPTGVLALGHSEMLPRDGVLTVEQTGEAFFYRHRSTPPPDATPPLPPALPRPSPRVPPAARRPVVARPPSPINPASPPSLLDEAESLADRGRLDDAARVCRAAIARDASLVRAHYLLGVVTMADPQQAYEHFRKAVYLDPDHLPARLHLAQCADRLGRPGDAAREYRNLERLAGSRSPDEVLDHREGITVGILKLAIRRGGTS